MADLCTLADVKLRIFQGNPTDTVDDTVIGQLITACSNWFENITDRELTADNAATYVFDTVEGTTLRIKRGIRAITSMGVNRDSHQPDSGGTYTTIPAADRLLRPKVQDAPEGWPFFEVRLTRGTLAGTIRTFGRIDNGCTITGDFGFATTPADVNQAVLNAVVAAYATRGNPAVNEMGQGIPVMPWAQYVDPGTVARYSVFA